MGNVSTRPHAGATAPKAGKAKPSTADTRKPIEDEAKTAIETVVEQALGLADQALEQFESASGLETVSTYGQILVELAVKALQKVSAQPEDAQTILYEAAGLLAGAHAFDLRKTPTCTSRHSIVHHACELVKAAARSFDAGDEPCEDLAKGIMSAKGAPAETFTRAQLETVLETIASRTRTLDLMLMELSARCYDQGVRASELATAVEGAQLIANGIGAMADTAVGGFVVGDENTWFFGPNFDNEGKAVQS